MTKYWDIYYVIAGNIENLSYFVPFFVEVELKTTTGQSLKIRKLDQIIKTFIIRFDWMSRKQVMVSRGWLHDLQKKKLICTPDSQIN